MLYIVDITKYKGCIISATSLDEAINFAMNHYRINFWRKDRSAFIEDREDFINRLKACPNYDKELIEMYQKGLNKAKKCTVYEYIEDRISETKKQVLDLDYNHQILY